MNGMARSSVFAMALFLSGSVVFAAAAPDAEWLRRTKESLAHLEYRFSPSKVGGWSAPNRSHDLRTFLGAAPGVEVTSRTGGGDPKTGGWRLHLELTGFGRAGAVEPVVPGSPIALEDRVDISRGGLTEWYVNEAEGLEQGFVIHSRPEGRAGQPVVLRMEISGGLRARNLSRKQSIQFEDENGTPRLRYGGLKIQDGGGRPVHGRLSLDGTRLEIRIDDRDALYPLTVDPLLASASWSAEGNQSGSVFGVSVAGAGDVNNDGYDDVLVGAPRYDNGLTDEGAAFLYLGSPAGLLSTPDWIAESNQANALFGAVVAGAGHVNSDVYADVLVSAPVYDNNEGNEGMVFLYYGKPGDYSTPGPHLSTTADWTAESNQAFAQFGGGLSAGERGVASAGDVDNDGHDDILVGSVLHDWGTKFNNGGLFLYLGGDPPSATPDWSAENDQGAPSAGQEGPEFGFSVGTAGDVDCDGLDDIIASARYYDGPVFDEGRVYVWYGKTLATQMGSHVVSTGADWFVDGDQFNAIFGRSVSTAGDVNGDGASDALIGCLFCNDGQPNEGRGFVHLGRCQKGSIPGGLATAPIWIGDISRAGANLGSAASGAGDVNGDGFDDVILGARGYTNGESGEGAGVLYLGSAKGPGASPARVIEGDQAGAALGFSVAGAGDVNGDHLDDYLVGAHGWDNDMVDEGAAYGFYGVAGASSVRGTVFRDTNQNCALGNAETPIPDRLIALRSTVNGGPNYVTLASPTGKFVFLAAPGEYTLSTVPKQGEDWLCSPRSVTVPENVVVPDQDLPRGGPIRDLGIMLYAEFDPPYTSPCPDQEARYCVAYSNRGDVNESLGRVRLRLPDSSKVEFLEVTTRNCSGGAPQLPVSVVPDNPPISQIVAWDIQPNFAKNESCTVCIRTIVHAPLDTVLFTAVADIFLDRQEQQQDMITGGDSANHATLFDAARKSKVACSEDPNELKASPGCGPMHYIAQGETLEYQVGFQNIGNAPATYVTIEDPLDANLDPETFQLIDTSHPLASVHLDPNGVLTFSFVNIDLPGAGTDEPGSHGFVKYTVRVRPSLPDGTSISNTASIVFDRNAAIVTNTAVSRVTDAVLPPGGVEIPETCNGLDDNCDSQIDEGNPGGGLACSTGLPGVCAAGITQCSAGSIVCVGTTSPATPNVVAQINTTMKYFANGSTTVAGDAVFVLIDSPMRYQANSTDPGIGLDWIDESFDDTGWASGTYGVGYDIGAPPDALSLIKTSVPAGTFSVFTRATFSLADVSMVRSLFLGADYDDGYVAYLNGVEVARSSTMPAGSPAWNTNAALHESSNAAVPNYGTLIDLTGSISLLHNGTNVLAVGVWNSAAATSTDLVIVPKLAIGLDWTARTFEDSAWTTGTCGVGYDTAAAPNALNLIKTGVPAGTLSVFTRVHFNIPDAAALAAIQSVTLGVDYDDGTIAWINGVEVLSSTEMPFGPLTPTTAPTGHESSNGAVPNYLPIRDITSRALPALVVGGNVLAIGVWNVLSTSTDLVLVPRLSLGEAERCDGLDNDCNGIVDDGFPDNDHDGQASCVDTDDDGDGAADGQDCEPLDPSSSAAPPAEISNLGFVRAPERSFVMTWTGQGDGLQYDVAGGLVSELLSDGGSLNATCVPGGDNLLDASFVDTRPAPAAGEAYYYLVRSQSSFCGSGTYGYSSSGSEHLPASACP